VQGAKILGLEAVAITDRNSLSGVVRAHAEAKKEGVRLVIGARLAFADGTPDILAYPCDRAAYGRLCRLLTLGNTKEHLVKGECELHLAELLDHAEGLLLALVPPARPDEALAPALARLAEAAPGRVWLAAAMQYGEADARRLGVLQRLAARASVPLLAVGDVLYHTPDRRPLQDVMTCIREHTTLAAAGRRLEANAERHLKGPAEAARLFAEAPEALAETLRLADLARFSLDEIRYEYPDDDIPEGSTAQEELERRVREASRFRYPQGVPPEVERTLAHELGLIAGLDYAKYFLTVHNVVKAAREAGILCQGRGSAANSAVCFVLRITEVDPARNALLFERFISPERGEPPDIDVDFEHERREEVIQWIYARYGRERAGIAATVITYRARSAVREVGKAFGLSDDVIGALAGTIWGWSIKTTSPEEARRLGLDSADPAFAHVLALAQEIVGFPRHLSQHVGGFVITRGRLDENVPLGKGGIEGRTFVEWDKDDLDALGILKLDVLALGMLTCIRKAFDLMGRHYGDRRTVASLVEHDDPAVYDMICRADTIGVFQIESRAQQSMLPRLRPREFYDLVVEVAIVRPGPIQGNMVHPYLRRRDNPAEVTYPSEALREVLHKTLGVPLFQEQAMRIAIVGAGFTPSEADRLRRAMATFRRVGTIGTLREKFLAGMAANGYDPAFAQSCWAQIEGFGSYGFPESHAAAFAALAYVSSWIKCRYPDVFAAALLNSQPMGFYAPAQIVRDAREHGVEIRPVDVGYSDWDATLEAGEAAEPRALERHHGQAGSNWACHALRLGMRQVKGLAEADGKRIVAARAGGPRSVEELWRLSGVPVAALERLAEADAFRSMGLSRREALWEVRALRGRFRTGEERQGDLDGTLRQREPRMALPPQRLGEAVIDDYRRISLSLKAHPVALLRPDLARMRVLTADRLADTPSGRRVRVAGLVLIRQRPGTASGTIFLTLEDETGVVNVIVWPKVFERYRPLVIGAKLMAVSGPVQSERGVVHVLAERIEDLSPLLSSLGERSEAVLALAHADEVRRPQGDARQRAGKRAGRRAMPLNPRDQAQAPLFDEGAGDFVPKSRDFH